MHSAQHVGHPVTESSLEKLWLFRVSEILGAAFLASVVTHDHRAAGLLIASSSTNYYAAFKHTVYLSPQTHRYRLR